MTNKTHVVNLTTNERQHLEQITRRGQTQPRIYKRALILLLSDQHIEQERFTTTQIATRTATSPRTVQRIQARYATEQANGAIAEKPRPGRPSTLTPEERAKITALACSTPPKGYARWSLRLLADRAVELELVESVSHETVGVILKKTR
jgi:putative transposase